MTISEKANRELDKAIRSLHRALEELENTTAYQYEGDIFHKTTKNAVKGIVNAINIVRDL